MRSLLPRSVSFVLTSSTSSMTSPLQQEACTFDGGSSPEFSVRDFGAGTNDKRDPTAESTVESSAAAALWDLAQGIEQPCEIDLTTEQGSVSLIGENNHITQLRVVIAQLCRKLRESSNWSTPQHTTLELQFHTLTGTVEYMKEQETILKARQEQIDVLRTENMALHEKVGRFERDCTDAASHNSILGEHIRTLREERKWFQSSLDRLEISNEGLRAENQRLQSELNIATGISERDAESEIGAQNKRSRQATIEAADDAIDLDTEYREGKRARIATGYY
ncbi:hypothetical protein BKA64DRAFT_756109 [Cadophora sp. MPI-SDFR-AT-0126]|nr:hypothetical protein BKA64DRAFT_756109 [Leotiomycetes sp. MPI-SDFR-AT-0126]